MRKAFSILLAAALVTTGAAARNHTSPRANAKGEAALAKMLEGRVAGKPVSCISLTNSRSSQILDGTAVVYQSTSRTIYVNRPRIGADSLDNDDILVTRVWGAQLCNLDQVTLVDRTSRFQHGFVSLGDFVPYTKPKA